MRVAVVFAVCALALTTACGKAPAAKVSAASVAKPLAEPTLAQVDLDPLPLTAVRDRLGQAPATQDRTEAGVHALLEAAADLLVVREAKVIGRLPEPGESLRQTSDRILAGIWPVDPHCSLDPQALKLAYLSELSKYKHPESWTVWDAQWQCCPDVDNCPSEQATACRKDAQPRMQALADDVRRRFQGLPHVGLPAGVTTVARVDSPWLPQHVPAFEAAVAAVGDPHLQLRRYAYFAQGQPGFERAQLQPGEPAIDAALRNVVPGTVVGPLDTAWGIDVVFLVAHEARLIGMKDAQVEAQVRAKACAEDADKLRQDYRLRLLGGARLDWHKPVIEQALGAEVVRKLPQGRPHTR